MYPPPPHIPHGQPPYAAPATGAQNQPPMQSALQVRGADLVTGTMVDLSGDCIKCGSPHAPFQRSISLSYVPPVTYLALIASLPAFVILALLIRKKSHHLISLCEPCNEAWGHSSTMGALSGATTVGSLIAGAALASANFIPAASLLLLIGPWFGVAGMLVARKKRLRAKRITDERVEIAGVSPRYLNASIMRALPPATPKHSGPGHIGPNHSTPGHNDPGHSAPGHAPHGSSPHVGPTGWRERA